MIKIELAPYPGTLKVYNDRKKYKKAILKKFGYEISLKDNGGRMDFNPEKGEFMVWADSIPFLAHEISHVILALFRHVGIHPCKSKGEPFCYMMTHIMSQLIREEGCD